METRIKRRMDEMHARRAEMEKKTEMERGTIRMGMAFTGGLFVLIMLAAKMMFPS